MRLLDEGIGPQQQRQQHRGDQPHESHGMFALHAASRQRHGEVELERGDEDRCRRGGVAPPASRRRGDAHDREREPELPCTDGGRQPEMQPTYPRVALVQQDRDAGGEDDQRTADARDREYVERIRTRGPDFRGDPQGFSLQ